MDTLSVTILVIIVLLMSFFLFLNYAIFSKKDTFIVLINVSNVCLSIGKSVSLGLSPISIAPLFLYCIIILVYLYNFCLYFRHVHVLYLFIFASLLCITFIHVHLVIISLLKCISLLHVSSSISVHLKIYVLIAICIQLEFSNIDVPSLIITTALLCECLTELLDHG